MTKTFTAATDDRSVTVTVADLAAAKRAARTAFDKGYIGNRIRIFEHTDTHGEIVVSTGYVGQQGWRDAQ